MKFLLNGIRSETGDCNLESAKFRGLTKQVYWHQILLAALLCQLSWRPEVVEAVRQVDRASIKGWTEVNKRWPLEESEFFVALAKGHHFIEVRLPPQLDHDLDIKLEYYYDYEKVRPVFQMVPCSTNVDIIKNYEIDSQRSNFIDDDRYVRDSAQPAGRWLTHEMRVRKVDCERRRELAYNVLLHDQNDVFAWRVIEIKSALTATTTIPTVPEHTTEMTQTTPTSETTDATQTTSTTQATETTDLSSEPETPLVSEPSADPSSTGSPQSAPLVSPGFPVSDDISLDDVADQFTKKPGEEVNYNPVRETTLKPPELNVPPGSETTTEGILWRLKRGALFKEEQTDSDEANASLICRPSSCDRSLFHHPRFMPLVRGVPKLPRPNLLEQNYKYYLNTDNKDLEFSQETSEDLSEVNLCVDLELYMDPETAIEFHVEDNNNDESKSRLLEVIERKLSVNENSPTGQSSGKWEKFKRCMSDYIPKLRPVDSTGHSIKFKFAPRPAALGKQVALLANPKQSVALSRSYTPKEYLPNVATLTVAEELGSYWIFDKDGNRRPKLRFDTRIPEEATSSDAGPKRVLHISNIDPKQESFDITSRWLKVSDLETLEHPINLFYRRDRADWVKEVEFGFQKASYPCDTWNTRKFYDESSSSSSITDTIITTTVRPDGEQLPIDSSSSSNNSTIATTSAPVSLLPGQMLVPINVIGLNTDEFRIRIRHFLKEEAQRANTGLKLDLLTLAFADACAESNFCLNGGLCKPTGTASAKCTCLTGYFGEHCQIVKPCEIIYGGQTGNQLCESVGAKCEQRLPVLRCLWPNDEYYECRALFKEANGANQTEVIPIMASSEMEDRLNDQTRTIIILSVFMAALLLFSVVIVGNMVSRLMESKKRLKKAQRETHELARRSQPGGSAATGGAAFGRLPARQKAAAVSYNNQAFDTD